jgi:hypothetical protein
MRESVAGVSGISGGMNTSTAGTGTAIGTSTITTRLA